MNGEGPKVQHVVPGEGVPLLNHHHFGTHQRELNGCPQATGASSDDEALNKRMTNCPYDPYKAQRNELHCGVIYNHRGLRLFPQKRLR